MMTTKFKGVLVAEVGGEWRFTVPLSYEQQQYVQALGLTEDSLLRKGKPQTNTPAEITPREPVRGGECELWNRAPHQGTRSIHLHEDHRRVVQFLSPKAPPIGNSLIEAVSFTKKFSHGFVGDTISAE
jgi:hypothetical protein